MPDVVEAATPVAEEAVLGICLQAPALAARVVDVLTADHFTRIGNQLVFTALAAIIDSGQSPDITLVLTELQRTGELQRAGGAGYLHQLYVNPSAPGNLGHFIAQLRDHTRARQARMAAQRVLQATDELAADPERMYEVLAQQLVALSLIVDAPDDDQPVEGLSTWDTFLAEPDAPDDWVVPGLIERQDVLMILASEGGGKSWLNRQFCLSIAAGIHPFFPQRRITPSRTLLIDLENAPTMVRRQTRTMAHQVVNYAGGSLGDRAHIWRRPDGLDLRKREDARLLERVIAETRPALVGLGSLYKAYKRGGDDWDTATNDVRDVLDHIRRRHRCAFILEHHMPKGDGRERPQTPYGSGEWMRWASHGRVIRKVGANAFAFEASFREDRDPREYPVGLVRGGELPWSPIWDPDELAYLTESQPAQGRRGR